MGMRVIVMLLAALCADEPSVEFGLQGSLKGAVVYNYVTPYLYLVNYEYNNPAAAHGMNGAVANPASCASIDRAAGAIVAGFGRRGRLEQTVVIDAPVVGIVDIPLSLYAAEHSGIYYGGAGLRIGEVVIGLSYMEGDRFQSEVTSYGEFSFSADYEFADTIPDPGIPEPVGDIPIILKLEGETGGIFTIDSRIRLRSTPLTVFVATEIKEIDWGLALQWRKFNGWIDYTDSASLRLDPSIINVYTESEEWEVDIDAQVDIEEEARFNSYYTTITGNEFGIAAGAQKEWNSLNLGASLGFDSGSRLRREKQGSQQRTGFPYLASLEASNIEVDEEERTVTGVISAELGYDYATVSEIDTVDRLLLPPRINFNAGFQVHPGDWIIDAVLNLVKTWGKGTSEVFFGTGFGYDWKVPLRFSQGIYYKVTKIEEVPIYTIPALFFGVSTTLSYQAVQLDLGIRVNTTTGFFTNFLAEADPDVPDLGALNHLSAGAAFSYEF
ncbi:hypothetical protein GF359_09005 [candidate division WOR-3 bacterium]|uniref:DUF5723 domain-containing protein n=1 Tax=candidate division WOR-3 bacterium TaxID=2052148 RepID=A0A9D5QD41_UNCW3|nr:hypothetical protein [candidate division WOR-3 bacterium]MBD3365338.1 hypothetical protein [candidate division WOR-3 bacterium]